MCTSSYRAERGWPPAVVAGTAQTAVVLMRNLARRGLTVSCIGCNRSQPGFRTIYGKAYCCPNPDDNPAGWLRFMIDLARQIGGRPVLIPSSDLFVTAIGEHAAELEEHFVFSRSTASVQALLATKQRQYSIAASHGLPVPRTKFVRSLDDVTAFSADARFPCLLKPLHCREWERVPAGHPLAYKKLVLAHSAQQLADNYRLASRITPEAVAQEVIEGPDTAKLVYLSCYGRGGERIAACMVRQLRTEPIYFGSASVVEPVSDPEADALCDRFLRSIGYVGLCEIELKRDSRDGLVKMIEANPRYSVTADAAPYLGVDLGWLHYLDLIGQPTPPVQAPPRAMRHIVLVRDFATIRDYFRDGLLTWRELIRSYRPPVAFFDFDLRDWRVTASNCLTLARLLARPALRRLLPKRRRPGSLSV